MNIHVILDKAGRIVIPRRLREQLHLEPGDTLEMQTAGEQLTLRPIRKTAPLSKERGVWVLQTGHPMPASAPDEVLRQIREERELDNPGKAE